jgi:hypothetical protein
MFEDVLETVEASLDVPYPDRALLLEEIEGDLESAYRSFRERGLSEADARAAALRELSLDEAAIRDVAAVHLPAVRRALTHLPPPAREWLESAALAVPLAGLVALLTTEVPLVHFLREGGFAIYLVLAVGVLALVLELQRAFLWFLLRDHSPAALRKNTSTPLYLAGATLCLGVLGTAVDYYVVFFGWSEGKIDEVGFRIGLREPLPCIIVGASLATLIFLIHGALQAGLRAIRIPEGKT